MAKRILIIEDDPDARLVYCTILRHVGYDVLEAAAGAEGITAAVEFRPHLIVLDVSLPGMSGWEVCAILKGRNDTASAVVLFATAHAFAEDRRTAFEVGADAYMTKPVEPRVIAQEVARLIGLP